MENVTEPPCGRLKGHDYQPWLLALSTNVDGYVLQSFTQAAIPEKGQGD
jgi:hypothetical protein